MKHPVAVIDTNVVVAGLITADADSPTARILDGMRRGSFPFLLSDRLLAEYREGLLRARICKLHGLAANEVDQILTEIATHAIVASPMLAPARPTRRTITSGPCSSTSREACSSPAISRSAANLRRGQQFSPRESSCRLCRLTEKRHLGKSAPRVRA